MLAEAKITALPTKQEKITLELLEVGLSECGIGGRRLPRSPPPRPDMAPVNKVGHVYTIARVAEMLGEDEDWLGDVANEMDREDGPHLGLWTRRRRRHGIHRFWDRDASGPDRNP